MAEIVPGAEPFTFEHVDSNTACLLIHGLTGSPQERVNRTLPIALEQR